MDSLGLTWFHLVALSLTWSHLDSLGLTWSHLDSLILTWSHLDSLGLTWSHLDSHWTHLVSLGLTWTHLDSFGLTWTHFWFHLDSLGLTWTHLVSLGLTWTHLVSLGLTGSHLVSLHLVSLGLTWTWTHLDSLGLTWTHLDSLTWSHWVSLGHWSHSVSPWCAFEQPLGGLKAYALDFLVFCEGFICLFQNPWTVDQNLLASLKTLGLLSENAAFSLKPLDCYCIRNYRGKTSTGSHLELPQPSGGRITLPTHSFARTHRTNETNLISRFWGLRHFPLPLIYIERNPAPRVHPHSPSQPSSVLIF